jgi:uncharacterized protein (TIGR03435 family)
MLQTLLAERFALKFHTDAKDQSVYALVIAKGGPKLKESGTDPSTPQNDNVPAPTEKTPPLTMSMPTAQGDVKMTRTKKTFAEMLSVGVVDRPVVDKTGLTGKYDVAVDLSPEDAMNVARASVNFGPAQPAGGGDAGRNRDGFASDPSGSSVLSSIQNLGLKLESRKLPVDMLIVDRMEKTPSAN